MDDLALQPWMLRCDWRGDLRPVLVVDLTAWPPDVPLDPLPPVPILAIGAADHPQAFRADVLVEDALPLDRLLRCITKMPRASMVLVQLLRAIEGLPPEQAHPLESFAFAMLQAGGEHAAWLAGRPAVTPAPPGRLHLHRQGAALNLLMDRPHARNAIDRFMRDALHEAFAMVALDAGISSLRLRAVGRCFSMGADLSEFGQISDPVEAHAIRVRALPSHQMVKRAEICDIHIQGGCVGSGLELAAFAGRLTAAPNAWFQLPETGMGILPGFGGCVSIPRRIGRQRAAGLMLSLKRINAKLALEWGLIDAIVDDVAGDEGCPHGAGG